MVEYGTAALDRTFGALSDPTRRAILVKLRDEASLSVGALAAPHALSLQAISKHLDVLEDAGLVTRKKIGRSVHCRLRAAPIEHAALWLQRYERFWSKRFDRLAAVVEQTIALEDIDADQAQPHADATHQGATRGGLSRVDRSKIR